MRAGLLNLSISVLIVSSSLAMILGSSAPSFNEIMKPGMAGAGDWRYYTVDTVGQVGPFNSLALDKSGKPHISYFDATNSDLKYAAWTGSGWQVETIDFAGYVGTDTSIAIDSQGRPHISYRAIDSDTNYNSLKYASLMGSSWSIETVETAYSTAFYTSLAIDKNDRPHISFYEGFSGYRIRHATSNGSGWSVDTVDYVSGTTTRTSIALDSLGHPHIAYYDGVPDYTLKHSWWDGTEWRNETLSGTRYVCAYASLAIDGSDTPHMTYQNLLNNYIRYASRAVGGWDAANVDSAGDACTFASLALDGAGLAHVAYSETARHSLRYANEITSGWEIETVNDTGSITTHISLALDSAGMPHISYYDETGQDLMYAAKVQEMPEPQPILSFTPSALDFGNLNQGQTATMAFGIWNSGGAILNYSFSKNASWIAAIDPPNGSNTGELDTVNVSVDASGLAPGAYAGVIAITSNGGNGTISVSFNVTGPTRRVTLRIEPRTINLKSGGMWIVARISVENASAADINASSLLLNDIVQPSWWKILGSGELMVKFDRASVEETLTVSDAADVKLIGTWGDGTGFEAHDIIRVIEPGR